MKYDEFVKMNEQGSTHWWYAARRGLLEQELKKSFYGSRNLKILDLASACGDNFSVCSDYGKVFGIDISMHAIRYCKEKNITTIVQGDVQKLPFKSNTYDIILALDVFEHLEDDIASMREIACILQKKGRLIFNVPAFMSLFSYHDKAFHHLRRYTDSELKKKLSLAGLEVKFVTYWSFFIFPAVYIVRKVSNLAKAGEGEASSDFYRDIPPFIEKVLGGIMKFESIFIKRNIPLPFGVSIYGIAQKSDTA